jgi:pilus assembly protein FimV
MAESAPMMASPAQPQAPSEREKYGPVKRGETLSGIAKKIQPEGVSLDQMLVGLFRENVDAFSGKNMNRLQAGRILNVPKPEALRSIDPAEAIRTVHVQAKEWHAYRQRLAGLVERQPMGEETGQSAAGKITPRMEEKAAPAAGTDVLKLSKGEMPKEAAANVRQYQEKIQSMEEEAKAREKTVRDANERIAMLEKSIQDMQRLLDMQEKEVAKAEPQKGMPSAPKAEPVPEAKPVPQAMPAAKVEAPITPPAGMPQTEEGGKPWYSGFIENPLYLGGGAAAVLLGGLLWLSSIARKRRKGLSAFEDSIMTGGEMRAKTVFGSATGGTVNTGDTSFLTEFSQAGLSSIDTHEVDPIAEAEVYMAYGRDAQAEEILKEAMAKNSSRHEIALKLLEIYASRKNPAAFEGVATELFAALGGQTESPVWEQAAKMGRELDPGNKLYGGEAAEAPAESAESSERIEPVEEPHEAAAESTDELLDLMEEEVPEDYTVEAEQEQESEEVLTEIAEDEGNVMDFDLDLPPAEEHEEPLLSFDEEAPEAVQEGAGEIIPQAMEKQQGPSEAQEETVEAASSQPEAEPAAQDESALDFDFEMEEEKAAAEAPPSVPEVDLSGIELDLGKEAQEAAEAAPTAENWQEVATKLDLARAYVEMGDKDGAREILEEVLAEGDAKQKDDANTLLTEIA